MLDTTPSFLAVSLLLSPEQQQAIAAMTKRRHMTIETILQRLIARKLEVERQNVAQREAHSASR
jgi:hypothetical protein